MTTKAARIEELEGLLAEAIDERDAAHKLLVELSESADQLLDQLDGNDAYHELTLNKYQLALEMTVGLIELRAA